MILLFQVYFRFPMTISAGGDGTKGINMGACIVAASIWKTWARDPCISNAYVVGIWIRCAGVGGAYTSSICARGAFV